MKRKAKLRDGQEREKKECFESHSTLWQEDHARQLGKKL
ncbi:hypothetical protein NEOC65_002451 [Neochlamydia sp. AcF65]|nr:hypothetical protein [Neochlamydia sp. AcF65]MBS4171369.1 hypothetical protein [Neochlamydia sp. AcF95]